MSTQPSSPAPIPRPLRWWHLALAAVCGGAVTGLAIYLVQARPTLTLMDNRPEAVAKLYAPLHVSTNLGVAHPDPPIERATHIALLKSQLVLTAALRPPEIASLSAVKEQTDPVEWLTKSLVVEFEGPEVIRISLTLDDPEQARLLVNAVKNAYLSEIHGKSARERKDKLDRLTDMSARADETLKRKQAIVQGIATTVGGLGTDAEVVAFRQKMALEQLNLAMKELAEVKSQIRKLTLEEAGLTARNKGAVEIPPDVLEEMSKEDKDVLANLLMQAAVQEQIETIRKTTREPEKHKGYPELVTKLAELKADQQKLQEKARARVVADFQAKSRAESAYRLQAVKQQLTMAKDHEALLNKEIPVLQKESTSVLTASQNLDLHRLELKQAEEMSTKIKAALTAMSMEIDAQPRVTNLEDAKIRERK